MDKELKKQILRSKLAFVEQNIYSAVIDRRIAEKASDSQLSEQALQFARKWERMKDELLKIWEEEIGTPLCEDNGDKTNEGSSGN